MPSRKLTLSIAATAAAIAIGGGSYAIASAASGSTPAGAPPSASSSPASGPRTSGGASNARSGPAAGGTEGTVSSVSPSGFTLTTSAGQKVTITEAPATTYHEGTSPASASAIANSEPVLVLGTTEKYSHRGHAGYRAPGRTRCGYGGSGRPLPARYGVHVQAGRPDPGERPPRIRDDRQRNSRRQGDRSGAGRLPRWGRRPRGAAEQRRV